ncbi:hypothetical protein JCGZ_24584 [Jatropha curcas]|uniref:Sulfotransferase n=1 Tax=Jatropha curcas TaxID=180498 RepID=A0A067L7V5_JATCU|nr:hypothetical protein JCGZ_24584 [Jatropha curcas]
MFLRYEDLKSDPKEQVKKLASFLGKPFAKEEKVDKVWRRCDFQRLKNLEVNKNGVDPWANMPNSSFFPRGVTGDWKNHLIPEMADKLDEIACINLRVLVLICDI